MEGMEGVKQKDRLKEQKNRKKKKARNPKLGIWERRIKLRWLVGNWALLSNYMEENGPQVNIVLIRWK